MTFARFASEVERFMSHVCKTEDGCWLWTAYRLPSGYGNFRTPARHELAHRAAHRMFIGPLDSRDVMHACDTPSCVNPAHLRLGTRAENMRDAKKKGRMAGGERHGRSKLSAMQVSQIRASPGLQKEVAALFGVSQSHVSEIKRGVRWAQPTEGNHHR